VQQVGGRGCQGVHGVNGEGGRDGRGGGQSLPYKVLVREGGLVGLQGLDSTRAGRPELSHQGECKRAKHKG
jgi:hypothetical protein